MMYLLTPEEYAQAVDTLDTIEALFTSMDIQHLLAYREVEAALAMLKAMKPVEPTFYMSKHQIKPRFYREGETLPTNVVSLYAKGQQ